MRGRVEEEIRVRASRPAAWAALTVGGGTRRWWGTLNRDLDAVAVEATVHTGSYSFDRVWVEERDEPELLELTSAYLGVAPATRVRFELHSPAGPGDPLVIRLRQLLPEDHPAVVHLAAELWRFRLARLKCALEGTAVPQEPDELVCSRPLKDPNWRPLHRRNLTAWLPVSGDTLPPRWFYVIDSMGARPFPVTSWQQHYDERLLLGIGVDRSGTVTRAEVAVTPGSAPTGLILRVTHRGFTYTGMDSEVRLALRSRFLATWNEALAQAVAGPGR
jgi:hypothetical protein